MKYIFKADSWDDKKQGVLKKITLFFIMLVSGFFVKAQNTQDFVITNKGSVNVYMAYASFYQSLLGGNATQVWGWIAIPKGSSHTIYGAGIQNAVYLAFAVKGKDSFLNSIGIWAEDGYYDRPDGVMIPVTDDNARWNTTWSMKYEKKEDFYSEKLSEGFARIPFTVRLDKNFSVNYNESFKTYFSISPSLNSPKLGVIPKRANTSIPPFHKTAVEAKKQREEERVRRLQVEIAQKEKREKRVNDIIEHNEMVNPKYLKYRSISSLDKKIFRTQVRIAEILQVQCEEKNYYSICTYQVALEEDLYKTFPSRTFPLVIKTHVKRRGGTFDQNKDLEDFIKGKKDSLSILIKSNEEGLKNGKVDLINVSIALRPFRP